MTVEQEFNDLNSLKKEGKSKRGGLRSGAGRRPNLDRQTLAEVKARIAGHAAVEIEVTRNGKMERILRIEAVLDILFREGMKGNIQAIKEYLDRQIGKATQPLSGGGEGGEITCVIVGANPDKYNLNKPRD